MRGAVPSQCLASLLGRFVLFTSLLVDVHIHMYTQELRVRRASDQGTESSVLVHI